jgi:hypothetical protein
MSACLNCKAVLSCGCQRKKASNGTSVCSNCIGAYEKSLKNQQPQQQTNTTDLNAFGKDRYRNLNKFIKR